MSWFNQFDASGFASLAKTALKEAQKTIDKALDIKEEEDDDGNAVVPDESDQNLRDIDSRDSQQKISKLGSSLWSSFTNSVFESEDEVADRQTGKTRNKILIFNLTLIHTIMTYNKFFIIYFFENESK